MKRVIVILAAISLTAAAAQAQQNDHRVGGEAIETLMDGKYSDYAKEYLRIYTIYMSDGTFKDYFADGQKYTVLVPDNIAVQIYNKSNPNNNERLRNTIKYSITKGHFVSGGFTDGQELRTLYGSGKYIVSVSKKGKVVITDMQGNRAALGESFESGNILFYPVKTFMRY